jgi:starch synthase
MNITLVTCECFPFAQASGLADIVCSLSKGLETLGHNVKVFMPRYGFTEPSIFHIEKLPLEIKVKTNGSYINTSIYKGIVPDSLVSVFLIESQNYFSNSKEIYLGEALDEERLDFFLCATLGAISELKLDPDIIHLFNPHTAYLLKVLNKRRNEHKDLNNIGTIFTLHSLFDLKGNLISQTKEAIKNSDYVTTISKSFRDEFLEEGANSNLSELLNKKENILGITSSIDEDIYSPETDKAIAQNFSKAYFTIGKRKCKEALLEELGLEINLQTPLFCVISRLTSDKGIDLLLSIIPQIANLNLQFIILGKGDKNYEQELNKPAAKYKNIRFYALYDATLARKIYSGSDFFINPSRFTSGLSTQIAMKYGTIPIVYASSPIKDITIDIEEGNEANSFTFKSYTKEDLLEVITKALKYYKNKEIWPKLVRQAMSFTSDNLTFAKSYLDCYEKALNKTQTLV